MNLADHRKAFDELALESVDVDVGGQRLQENQAALLDLRVDQESEQGDREDRKDRIEHLQHVVGGVQFDLLRFEQNATDDRVDDEQRAGDEVAKDAQCEMLLIGAALFELLQLRAVQAGGVVRVQRLRVAFLVELRLVELTQRAVQFVATRFGDAVVLISGVLVALMNRLLIDDHLISLLLGDRHMLQFITFRGGAHHEVHLQLIRAAYRELVVFLLVQQSWRTLCVERERMAKEGRERRVSKNEKVLLR